MNIQREECIEYYEYLIKRLTITVEKYAEDNAKETIEYKKNIYIETISMLRNNIKIMREILNKLY